MKRLLGRLYAVGSILFFLGITVYFFVQLSETRAENELRASSAFDTLAGAVSAAWQDIPLPAAGDRVTMEFAQTQGLRPLVVSVYSFDLGIDYLWAIDDRFITGTPDYTTSAPPVITSNEIVHRRFSRSFRLPNGERRIVTAVYPVLDERSVFPVLRVVLILVLAFLSVVLLLAIVHALGARNATSVPARAATRTVQESPVVSVRNADAPPETVNVATQTVDSRDDGSALVEEAYPSPDAPEPVFTKSGLAPESVLDRRLTLELERAAFQEQDLSVAVFRFGEGTKADEAYLHNAKAVLAFFSFEDLCFELGEHEIAVVFPATTLRDSLGQIERFQRYYWEERQNWKMPAADFSAGVSSRNGRLVEGNRVLRESRLALDRAEQSTGRIMGFHPDPQRYRSYLLDQSR